MKARSILVGGLALVVGIGVSFIEVRWATSAALASALVGSLVLRASSAGALAWMGLYAAVLGWASVDRGVRGVWAILFVMLAAYGGACMHRRLRAERWGPTAVVTALSLTLSVIAAHVTITTIFLRAHPSPVGSTWLGLCVVGLLFGAATLFSSVMPWKALRRAAAARGGRIDAQGLIRFFDGREGRSEPGEPGEVIGWRRRQRLPRVATYREDAGPAHFVVFRGDRSEYVEHARRTAMEMHLWGLAIAWLTGGPLIGARLAGLF